MAALFIGTLTGMICAVFAAWMGASILAMLCVYAVSGMFAVLAHAVVIAIIEPAPSTNCDSSKGLDPETDDP